MAEGTGFREMTANSNDTLRRDAAIEQLAEALWLKQDHLDPGEGEWSSFTEHDKEFYRQSVEWLLCHPDLIRDALQA